MKIKADRKQTLSRLKLRELYSADNCHEWQRQIKSLLEAHFDKSDDFEIEIDYQLIVNLMADGTNKQKSLAKKAGLKLIMPLLSDDLKPGEMMTDEEGDLLLIVEDGFVCLDDCKFYPFEEYNVYGERMPKDFQFTIKNKVVNSK